MERAVMRLSLLLAAVMMFFLVVSPSVGSSAESTSSKDDDDDHVQELHAGVGAPIPEKWDWRLHGAVSRVKDQRKCKACWAFSAVAAVEGALQIARKTRLIPLSVQELIDCDARNDGCSCGFPRVAFNWIKTRGLVSEYDYPYRGKEGTCRDHHISAHRSYIADFRSVYPRTERALQAAVANHGPVSVAVRVTRKWNKYKGGIIRASACKPQPAPNHAVTIVGYNTSDDGVKYWIVKNSWGKRWGDRGYVYLERDVGRDGGFCGITYDAAYPIVRY